MIKKALISILFTTLAITLAAQSFSPEILAATDDAKGLLCRYQRKNILFAAGTPEEMGTAHGTLLAREVKQVYERILLVAAGYLVNRNDWFFTRIEEVMKRNAPYLSRRYLDECNALAQAAGMPGGAVREINFFPEMFHCSGVAVRGKASGGVVVHARVLDYMRDIRLQKSALLIVYMPDRGNAWVSVSYAGFVGTVTAMNEHGLAMGEMGGAGYGKWDGLPMAFMIRRVMEECSTVAEALELMRSVPLTCDYYYVLSDRNGDMAAVTAIAGQPLGVTGPGEQHPELPLVPEDTVFISGGERAKVLGKRLQENFGSIDARKMIEIIKRPVAMKSNLHNAVFLPQSGDLYFADAGAKTPACDEPYVRVNLREMIDFYRTRTRTAGPLH
jgi:hypothetical protein